MVLIGRLMDGRTDVATGETPARQMYAYPRDLARTASHDELLRQFREAGQPATTLGLFIDV